MPMEVFFLLMITYSSIPMKMFFDDNKLFNTHGNIIIIISPSIPTDQIHQYHSLEKEKFERPSDIDIRGTFIIY
jgi:hypothetical protein